MNGLWIAAAIALMLSFAAVLGGSRRRRLDRLRGSWGLPIDRPRRFDAISASHRSRTAVLGGRSLDDRTWADLNLSDVFAALDRTQSTLGQHALYHRLRTAPVAPDLAAFEALTQRMTQDQAGRERAQVALARLQDPHGYDLWWLGAPGAVEQRRWYAVFPVLTCAALVLAVLAPFRPAAVMPLVAVLALNVAIRYLTDSRIGAVARSFRQCAPVIATAEALRFLTGDDIDPIVRALRADAPALGRLKSISRWVNGDPFMLPAYAEPMLLFVNDFVAAVYEYFNLAFVLDGTGVYFAVRDLSRYGASLGRAAAAAGEVDAAIAIASFRAGRSDWTRPDFHAAGATAELTDVRHPLVEGAVPNSIALPAGRGALITGSNMSGKSTFLRSVGVNALLAQTVHTCFARVYRAPIFDVRSCIGRADDLLAGKSYYLAEVEALLELVRASDESAPHLFLLDELFRGTNAVERIAAGQAVLQELLVSASGEAKRHVVVAATHDGELVGLATGFEAYHFGDSIGADGLSFDHRLEPGPATSRNAIALLRLYGAPSTLLAVATATAEKIDRERGTAPASR